MEKGKELEETKWRQRNHSLHSPLKEKEINVASVEKRMLNFDFMNSLQSKHNMLANVCLVYRKKLRQG